jgi:plastocyanin
MIKPRLLRPLALVALGLLAATSPPTFATSTPATSTPQGDPVVIIGAALEDNEFVPKTLTAPTGTTVIWRNTGTRRHTATADNGAFDTGIVRPGAQGRYTFNTPGTYTYHCSFHKEMVGTIVILGNTIVILGK